MKHDLTDTTFIIPLCVESDDRAENALITLSYLFRHLNTNIVVHEYGKEKESSIFIRFFPWVQHQYKQNTGIFHRTKYLNEMLSMVKTPIVVNYDIDVLLNADTFLSCVQKIRQGADLVYPYFLGNSQYKVNYEGREKVKKTGNLKSLCENDVQLDRSEFGHCQFFSTESYRRGGGENEQFISYAPEDAERAYRFQKLGYNVSWGTDYIYHLEHSRGVDSSSSNPHFRRNNQLFERIKDMSVQELRQYYERDK
ncbi:MAG: hypothetical protein V4714_08165 [Bacteroidota bacterium]